MFCRHSATALAIAAATFLAAAGSGAQITSAPPAQYRGATTAKMAVTLQAPAAEAHRIDLDAPVSGAVAALKARNAVSTTTGDDKGQPLAIGFGRDVPFAVRTIVLQDLAWTLGADGSRTARIEVTSPGAAAVRVALRVAAAPSGLEVRFAGTTANATVFGPYAAAQIVRASTGLYWSPVLAGETAVVELHANAATPIEGVVLDLPKVSHQMVANADLRSLTPKDAKAIGSSGSCNIDVACVVPVSQAVLNAAKSVARLSFVADDGFSYLCTGTLVNDSSTSFTPYLFTANHCLDSAAAARTLNSFWFYDAVACNDRNLPPFVQLAGGASLLARSQDSDWSLLRLLETPPFGVIFSAWRAEPIPQGAVVSTIHHPAGDLKKWSQGSLTGFGFIGDSGVAGNFNEVTWSAGTTEGGSSGSPLLTFLAGQGFYELRGGLFGGGASCTTPAYPDYFSDLQAALPLVRQYLTPNAPNPAGLVAATEFYNAKLDHYFISTNPVEINNLDSGATIGWVRTGFRFMVYNIQAAATNPVCRFYRAPAYGDSHFYSASPAECAATAAAHPVDWIYESPSVFYVRLPDTGTGVCPGGTRAVYRFFNVLTENHRYTIETTVRDELALTPGWIAEGYGSGPYFPIMCAVAQ